MIDVTWSRDNIQVYRYFSHPVMDLLVSLCRVEFFFLDMQQHGFALPWNNESTSRNHINSLHPQSTSQPVTSCFLFSQTPPLFLHKRRQRLPWPSLSTKSSDISACAAPEIFEMPFFYDGCVFGVCLRRGCQNKGEDDMAIVFPIIELTYECLAGVG